METMLELLKEIRDDIDFENCETLIDDGVLESLDILQIISAISEEYDVTIPAKEIVPDNFNSAKRMLAMVNRLLED